MQIKLDTRLEAISPAATKASLHMDFCGGSFTISNILLKKKDNGNWSFTLPLIRMGENQRPVITLQGAMKQTVFLALSEDHAAMRASDQKRFSNSRVFEGGFPPMEPKTAAGSPGLSV